MWWSGQVTQATKSRTLTKCYKSRATQQAENQQLYSHKFTKKHKPFFLMEPIWRRLTKAS